ncbi:MAG TPA: DUF3619 family protein [Paucimonas sp.]|nr:DUF3619 family protein [Paucimonas sp.]
MNAKDLNFAYKVRHALNENLDNLPASTVDQLASSRKIAISRKKTEHPLRLLAVRRALAGGFSSFFDEPLSWLAKVGMAVPVVVLAVGLVDIYQMEEAHRIAETADIDAAVLADELPLNAYVDHGFNAYLAKRAD